MFGTNQPYAKTGTTSPIYIPRDKESTAVRPGQDYFYVQIHSAQAAFSGSIWEKVKNLVVATSVNVKHANLGQESLRAIQRTREVHRDRAEQLGLQPNLIDLIPAVMPEISVSIDFILDKENMLHNLSGLINNNDFLAAISLAPGAALVAKTISGLAGKIIETFVPANEREPILQFSGDFNLAGESLLDGYYVILGTRDDRNPIPSPMPKISLKNGELLADNEPITQLSYVVIDVHRTPVRTRALNNGGAWEDKLREAENEASRFAGDPLADDGERKSAWEKCRNLLKEAQTLLRSDPNFLRSEAEAIIKASLAQCTQDFGFSESGRSGGSIVKAARGPWQPDLLAERRLFDIAPGENLKTTLDAYQAEVAKAQPLLSKIQH